VVKHLAVVLVALLALGLVGCAHRTPTVAPAPKPDAGTVGLAVAPGPSTPSFQRPGAVGAGDGARKGAARGVLATLLPGLVVTGAGAYGGGDAYGLVARLMLLGAGGALAPVGAGVGAAVGAIVVPGSEEVERSAAALERAFADADLSYSLTAWIMDAAGQRPIVTVADRASPMIDSRLEIDAPSVSLTSKDATDWWPALRLRVSIRARLLRASDGEELRAFAWEQEGPTATFRRWGKDDARLFRAELEHAGRALAAKVVADLY
jgi:hypothetical protein